MDEARSVWLLWHGDDIYDETPDAKLLGVYSSRSLAERRVESARLLPGFRRYPDDFVIGEYRLDEDEWTTGFATATSEGWVDDPEPEQS